MPKSPAVLLDDQIYHLSADVNESANPDGRGDLLVCVSSLLPRSVSLSGFILRNHGEDASFPQAASDPELFFQ
ncbi:hypothetical protein K7X08_005875 [Anisodus acutangulus]|uniref:Uncharacterized protein n=1 Tax=Anisodus acutangulus TaxID=402998 RepID=A0A9Q1LW96_9SOLA|nr:hypothetical protein K7X08_005875 [Anisodus acutangulus]